MSISDWHAQLDPLGVPTGTIAVGGAAVLSAFFNEEPAIQAMNLMGIEADTFGARALGCGQVVAVFGGGNDQATTWQANWIAATSGGLSLNNDGDEVRLGLTSGD